MLFRSRTASERIIIDSIKNNIAIYSAHTNLDVAGNGVSRKMASKLGLINVKALIPLKNRILKLVVYIPEAHADRVSEAIFNAGAGVIGNYDRCGFMTGGTGSYRAGESADPFAGKKGEMHFEKEMRFETILFSHLKKRVVNALLDAHPYEEVAYDLYALENDNLIEGMGCIGELSGPAEEKDFLEMVRSVFKCNGIRYSGNTGRKVAKVALCGGSGASLMNEALALGADVFITGDLKYHNFLDAGKSILMIDAGHYESEKFATEILYDLLIKKFPKFALRFSEINKIGRASCRVRV